MTSQSAPFTLSPAAIQITGLQGQPIATLNLRFTVGTRAFAVTSLEPNGSGYIGQTQEPTVTVEIFLQDNNLSVELKGPFAESDTVVYFCESTVTTTYGRAFVPDADCRRFLTRDKEDFYLTNAGMILQKKVNKPDLWMIAPPPHVFSFGDDASGWFGFSIPEPLPVEFTRLSCHQGTFSLGFSNHSPRHAAGRLPRVFLDFNLPDSKAILDRHAAHATDLGLINPDKPTYSWWYNPIYCSWGDQCYVQKTRPLKLGDPISFPLSAEQILRWADGIRAIYPGEVNYIVDAGWFDFLGDYMPEPAEFPAKGDFQLVLNQLKAKGFRVILWYTPFWVQPNSRIDRERPEWLVRRRDGTIYRDQDGRGFLDFSQPAVRAHTKGRIEYFLRTLDADGFKIDMNYVHPLMSDITLADSSWGHGNQLWLEVAKFIHDTATAIKADAFFTLSGIESYLQPYASSIRLNDLFDFVHAKAWYDRAEMVARLMPHVPMDVDGWPSSLEKMREYQFVSPVFGAPVTYYIEAVDIMTTRLSEADLNRMASVWHVYRQAPCAHGMRLTIDSDTNLFERHDASGHLQAKAIDQAALVSFTADSIYVTSNSTRALSIPITRAYTQAEKIYRDGRRELTSFFQDGNTIVLNVLDAGTGILCYKIT